MKKRENLKGVYEQGVKRAFLSFAWKNLETFLTNFTF